MLKQFQILKESPEVAALLQKGQFWWLGGAFFYCKFILKCMCGFWNFQALHPKIPNSSKSISSIRTRQLPQNSKALLKSSQQHTKKQLPNACWLKVYSNSVTKWLPRAIKISVMCMPRYGTWLKLPIRMELKNTCKQLNGWNQKSGNYLILFLSPLLMPHSYTWMLPWSNPVSMQCLPKSRSNWVKGVNSCYLTLSKLSHVSLKRLVFDTLILVIVPAYGM